MQNLASLCIYVESRTKMKKNDRNDQNEITHRHGIRLAVCESENGNMSRLFTTVMASTDENQGQCENAHTPRVTVEN